MKKILVLCTGNSCRSQIAEGYLRYFANGKAEVFSAGIETHGVNSRAIEIMREDGIDISGHTSNNLLEYSEMDFDYVITVCDNAKERCPYFPSKAQKFHCNFPDPAKAPGNEVEILEQFRNVRNQIKDYSRDFIMLKVVTLSEEVAQIPVVLPLLKISQKLKKARSNVDSTSFIM